MANEKIELAVERGGMVYVYGAHGRCLVTMPAGGTYASDGLKGYTPSTFSIRRGATIYTYNEKGRFLQQHTAGPPTPKVKPAAPARVALPPRPVAPPPAPKPKNSAMAPYAKSAPASAASAVSAPARRNNWFQRQQQLIPIPTDPREVVPYYDETETEEEADTADFEDTGASDDIEISEMAKAIPDEVRGLILTLERRRRRWKILAITFMILFSLFLSVIVLAIAVAK